MVKTTVINLLGAGAVGKSTTAAGIFYRLKQFHNVHCELIQEYVKTWAWQGKRPSKFDQLYLLGKQSQTESRLYGKVDYIITDSPIILSPFYEEMIQGVKISLPAAKRFLSVAKESGIKHLYFFLERKTPYDSRGRYGQSKSNDVLQKRLPKFLKRNGIKFDYVKVPEKKRVDYILKKLKFS